MARPLRVEFEGALYHITSRGNAGRNIFLDDRDRLRFLDVLRDVVDRFGWLCHAYCLMSNHYHLLAETPHSNLSRGMRHLNGVYTQAVNQRHKRTGHIFQGRFKSILVEKESHLLQVARYVVLNPVRAQIVKHARQWRWSSYRAMAGEIASPDFLTTEWLLAQFHDRQDRARLAYRRFVAEGIGKSIWDDMSGGFLLGSEAFCDRMKPLLRDAVRSKEIPRVERMLAEPTLQELFNATEDDRRLRNKRIHEAIRHHDYTLKQLQDYLGLHYSSIRRIARNIDEQ
jgi:putative transposase